MAGSIDQVKYHRTHCNYKEYIDFDSMSSNLLKNIVDGEVLKKKCHILLDLPSFMVYKYRREFGLTIRIPFYLFGADERI